MNNTQALNNATIQTKHKHKYCTTFGEANINYHSFDNQDALTYKDKYTTLLEQELQNPYWCLHDPITTLIKYLKKWK